MVDQAGWKWFTTSDHPKDRSFDVQSVVARQKLTTFSKVVEPGRTFTPWSWAPDGREVAGPVVGGTAGPIFIYSLATGTYTRVYDSEHADFPTWLKEGRRLLLQERSRILLLDLATREARELMSVAPDTLDLWSITGDNQTVLFRSSR